MKARIILILTLLSSIVLTLSISHQVDLVANAQTSPFTLKMELRGTVTTNPPQLADGATLTILLTVSNTEVAANPIAYGVDLQFQKPNESRFTSLFRPAQAATADLTCAVGSVVTINQIPLEPQNNFFSTTQCDTPVSLASQSTQIFAIRLDTSRRTDIVFDQSNANASYSIRANIVDPRTTNPLISDAITQSFSLIASTATLKFHAPIGINPLIPPQGALPTLSFSVANTGRGGFADSAAIIFFTIVQTGPSSQPAVDFSILIAQTQACDIDTSNNQVKETSCRVIGGRQVILPAFGEGALKQLRLVFFTSALEPGPYQIRGCLKKSKDLPSTERFCDPSSTNPAQLDTFTLNFQVGSPDGVISVFVAPDSPTQSQIEQGKNATVLLTVANFTGIFQRSISFSFSLDPKASRKVPLECKEPLEQGVEFDLARGDQCVLENVSPSRSQDIGVRKMRVILPTSEFKKDQLVTLTVSDGGRLLRPSAKIAFQVVEKASSGGGTGPGQQPSGPGPELHALSLEFVPTSPVSQGQVVLIRSKIENSGNRFSGSFTVNFQLFSVNTNTNTVRFVAELGETRKFPGIDPNVIIEASTLLDTCARASNGSCTLETGTYLVKVIISAVPNELDRTNNELSTLLTIQPPKK